MRDWYRLIMDSDVNPLSSLPPIRRFQLMVMLSVAWTMTFVAAAGAWVYAEELLVAHIVVASTTLLTGISFNSIRSTKSYRDYPRSDGTPRYDDVWGA
jgi:hypothetical protein